jgi:hypothetical protein
MALTNVNAPKGFVPSRYLNGAAWNGGSNLYRIPSTDGVQYGLGDAVTTVVGGDANGIPNVAKASGTAVLRGVIVGILPAPPNQPSLVGVNLDLTIQNIPATKTKDYYVQVVDDPNVLFEIIDDGLNTLTATSLNKNASFTVANPTSPQQNSASVLNTGSVGVANTLNLKLVGLVQKPNNYLGTPYMAWLVKINLHELLGGQVGF